jgi:hypothetical protein
MSRAGTSGRPLDEAEVAEEELHVIDALVGPDLIEAGLTGHLDIGEEPGVIFGETHSPVAGATAVGVGDLVGETFEGRAVDRGAGGNEPRRLPSTARRVLE